MARVARSWVFALVAALLSLHALPALASNPCGATYDTLADAYAACKAFDTRNSSPPYNNPHGSCSNHPNPGGTAGYVHWTSSTGDAGGYGDFSYCSGSEGDICSARSSYQTAQPGNLTLCQAGCKYAPSPGHETWTVRGITGGTSAIGAGKMQPTGETCGAGPIASTEPLPTPATLRRLCGGGSCYDSSSGDACAVAGDGSQVCVKVKGAPPSGSCASGGGTTLCAGNPAPTPPNPPISDPASQIAATDHFTSQTDNGPVSNTTVNNYNDSGAAANPGTTPDDTNGKGDKPDDQKKDDGTTASGGGDCKTAPMVEGSAALGMVAMQEWRSRCEQPDWTKVSDSDGDQYKVTDTSRGDVFKTEGEGLDKIDQSSWAGNSCPALPTPAVYGTPFLTDQDFFCQYLALVRAIVMLAGGVAAAVILAAGSKR